MINKKTKLSNGYYMPLIGLGTWQIKENDIENTINTAISYGYSHIDTAHVYENEAAIGQVIKKYKREDLFITSKLWNTYHLNPEDGLNRSLNDLKLEYLDLYLVHWPVTFKSNNGSGILKDGKYILEEFNLEKLWRKMEEFVYNKKVRSIGVSNFGIKNMNKLLKIAKIKPVVLQVECHPYFQQCELKKLCDENKIHMVAYSSFGSNVPVNIKNENVPKLIEDKIIRQIAEETNLTCFQVILSFLVSKNISVIPKSTNAKHIKENSELIILDEKYIKQIESIKTNYKFLQLEAFGENRFQ